jgi:hypothetical protein
VANRRYINVSVFSNGEEFWNLGLVKIVGSGDAKNIWDCVKARLLDFGIDSSKQIVSCVTDGASVMTKITTLTHIEHQFCLNHGIQLAVTDVLYPKKLPTTTNSTPHEPHDSAILSSPDSDDGSIHEMNGVLEIEREEIMVDFSNVFVNQAVNKVRKIARLFRKSPTKNEILQKYVLAKEKKELHLILDCKTRWSSLLDMVQRYWLIRDCVEKALIDVQAEVEIDRAEKYILHCILTTLKPVAEVVEVN